MMAADIALLKKDVALLKKDVAVIKKRCCGNQGNLFKTPLVQVLKNLSPMLLIFQRSLAQTPCDVLIDFLQSILSKSALVASYFSSDSCSASLRQS